MLVSFAAPPKERNEQSGSVSALKHPQYDTFVDIEDVRKELDTMMQERDHARRYPWTFIKHAIKCRQTR